MTWGKTAILVLGLVGAVALGVWIGPYITERATPSDTPTAEASQPTEPAATVEPTAKRSSRRAAARAARSETAEMTTPEGEPDATSASASRAVSPSAPELRDRLKPVLSRGTDFARAAEGFGNAEQFATLAHAARNTQIPFVLLKHRVLNEKKSLSAAIAESKPDVDAAMEATRAREQARSDLSSL